MAGFIYGPLIMTLFLAMVRLYQTRYQQHIARRLAANAAAPTAAPDPPRRG
jgi:hypothetical protein